MRPFRCSPFCGCAPTAYGAFDAGMIKYFYKKMQPFGGLNCIISEGTNFLSAASER